MRARVAVRIVLAAACVGAAASACTNGAIGEQHDYSNFQRAVAKAPQQGYTPYWLGRSFEAGGLTFNGPFVADFGDEVSGGGLSASYDADLTSIPRGVVELSLQFESPAAWARDEPLVAHPRDPGAQSSTVQLLGQDATLWSIPGGTRPVNQLQVVLQFGTTTVIVRGESGGPAKPGSPDVNPLVDEATLLSVLAHLRPYPQ
jgi:hypothetical protein